MACPPDTTEVEEAAMVAVEDEVAAEDELLM